MKTRTKKVRITINYRPITNLSTGVILSRGTYSTMTLDEADIFKCICGKAIVEEELPDGSFTKLDLFNYNKYNNKVNDSEEELQKYNEFQETDHVPSEEGAVLYGEPATEHELVNPNVAPMSQKELVNPAANIAGMADMGTDDLETSKEENEDVDAEHGQADEKVIVPPAGENASPKKGQQPNGYRPNGQKNRGKN